MVGADERVEESRLNSSEVLQSERTFIQFALFEPFPDNFIDNDFKPLWQWIIQRPGSGFHSIGKHQYGRLPRLRLGAGIPVILFVDFLDPGLISGLL